MIRYETIFEKKWHLPKNNHTKASSSMEMAGKRQFFEEKKNGLVPPSPILLLSSRVEGRFVLSYVYASNRRRFAGSFSCAIFLISVPL